MRVREFIMKDAYSFHVDQEDLTSYYPDMCRAYERICQTCGVPVVKVLDVYKRQVLYLKKRSIVLTLSVVFVLTGEMCIRDRV